MRTRPLVLVAEHHRHLAGRFGLAEIRFEFAERLGNLEPEFLQLVDVVEPADDVGSVRDPEDRTVTELGAIYGEAQLLLGNLGVPLVPAVALDPG